jgi:predicted transcriptional regulator
VRKEKAMPKKSDLQLSPVGAQIYAVRSHKNILLTQIAKNAKLDYSQLYRIMYGLSKPSHESLVRICKALSCTYQEAQDIMHAAGYHLSPDELDEEEAA